MAIIGEFVRNASGSRGRHPTTVTCGWSIDADDQGTLVTLSTYGSDTRQKVGGISQTIQLDRRAAQDLVTILAEAFHGVTGP